MFKTTLLALTATIALMGAASTSYANDTFTASVKTNDLNLASPAGVAVLDQRIVQAAKLVCGPLDIKSTRAVAAWNACHQAAVDGAKAQVEAAVAAYRDGKALASADLTVSR